MGSIEVTIMKKYVLLIILIPVLLSARELLRGGGATFPYPLYQKWISLYSAENDCRISYDPVGSTAGIRGLLNQEYDFGASDMFLSEKEMASTTETILHIPTCVGAIVVIYNLPGDPELNFSPGVLSDIFMGKINFWNDSAIQSQNPHVDFPDLPINVVHRSDGSGTTFLFTHFLSHHSHQWREQVGHAARVDWPVGMGVEGNANMAEFTQRLKGSIAYVELSFAVKQDLAVANISNAKGVFVKPSLETVSLAAAVSLPDDARLFLTDLSSEGGYPISSFSYIIFPQSIRQQPAKAKTQIGRAHV